MASIVQRFAIRSDPAPIPMLTESNSLKQMGPDIIRNLLARHSTGKVCTRLGISRETLWHKIHNMTFYIPNQYAVCE